jgi:tryptophanyl-tRNA synthetase
VIACIVDLHALTVEHEPALLRDRTVEMAATLLACGLDPSAHLFVQSSVRAHTELSYLLESTATYGEMRRMVQFKQKSRGQDSTRLSLLTYPALMAADILAYRADVVPVGDDQRQHLELTTTLARRFNARYGAVFTVPRAMTPPDAARVKDLREPATKMGKSGSDGAGVVFLLDSPDVIAAKVRRAVTDPDPQLDYRPEQRPGVANLAVLLGALTHRSPETLAGLHGSEALKSAVTDALVDTLAPIRKRFEEIAGERGQLLRDLQRGADEVVGRADATLAEARRAIGLLDLSASSTTA